MKVLRLTHISGGGDSCVYKADDCDSLHEEINEMKYCEIGEEWKITVEEMTQSEFEGLVEFIGW